MGNFKYVLTWLFIFIVGGLIVSFLISPNSLDSFKENARSIAGKVTDSSENIKQSVTKTATLKDNLEIEEQKDNFKEIDLIYRTSCSVIETASRAQGLNIEQVKENQCIFWCGQEKMDYHHFGCITDTLHCFCKLNA